MTTFLTLRPHNSVRYRAFPSTNLIVRFVRLDKRTESYRKYSHRTAIVQKVHLVRDIRVKRTIRRSLRGLTGFEVSEVIRGIGGVRYGLIKVAVM